MAATNHAERIGRGRLGDLADVGWQRLQRALQSFTAVRVGVTETRADAARPCVPTAPVSALLAQALAEDSHLELDWLWYASQLEDTREHQYCVRRALFINPRSELARRELMHPR